MDEKMLEIINLKSFSELTEAEKNEFRELFSSEEEFEALKQFYGNFEGYKKSQNYSTHYMTKGSLDELFASEYPNQGIVKRLFPSNKPFYLNPILQIAAVVLVILLVYNLKEDEINRPQLATVKKSQDKRKVEQQQQRNVNNLRATQNTIQNEIQSNFTDDQTTDKNPILIARNSKGAVSKDFNSDPESGTFSNDDLNDVEYFHSIGYTYTTETASSISAQSEDISMEEVSFKTNERKSSKKSVNNQKDLLDLLTPVY
jgi:hypothetical protein